MEKENQRAINIPSGEGGTLQQVQIMKYENDGANGSVLNAIWYAYYLMFHGAMTTNTLK